MRMRAEHPSAHAHPKQTMANEGTAMYGVMPKQKLQVVVNPYRAPSIDVLLQDEQGRLQAIYDGTA